MVEALESWNRHSIHVLPKKTPEDLYRKVIKITGPSYRTMTLE